MEIQHHIQLTREHLEGNEGIGRYVLLPGDPSRAERIAQSFEEVAVRENPRGFHAYLGRLASPGGEGPVEVLAIPTGIGSASTEVVVRELLACGARRLLRVGSCGTGAPPIRPGQVVIATGAVRDEATTYSYAPEGFPAVAHPAAVAALTEGARRAGLADESYRGLCHSKASLYGREFGHGPAGERNLEYVAWLRRCGVIASEMEASALFVLASTAEQAVVSVAGSAGAAQCQAGAVLAVFARDDSHMEFDPETAKLAEERAIRVALEGVRVWAESDGRSPEISRS
jgi:uridine phosphorylase